MVCREIIRQLEQLSPPAYACGWDNVGLLVGRADQTVGRIVVALDATEECITYAVEQNADLIVTHHPMIFSPLKQMNDSSLTGRKMLLLAENKVACYAMHTNFDIKGGMAELAAARLRMEDAVPLEVTAETSGVSEGIGRVGAWKHPVSLRETAEIVKKAFDLSHVLVYGRMEAQVRTVAVCPGSGKSEVGKALDAGADVLITGDIGHHDGLDAVEQGMGIIDAGHYGLEHIFIEYMKEYLSRHLPPEAEILTWEGGVPYEIV